MAKTLTRLVYHVVFSTKNRLELIPEELESRLYAYIGGIVRNLNGRLLTIGGTACHVHPLLSLPPELDLSRAVMLVKTNSSRWLGQQPSVNGLFGWQRGYAAFAVGRIEEEALKRYIRNQKEHHKTVSPQDEWNALLEAQGLGHLIRR